MLVVKNEQRSTSSGTQTTTPDGSKTVDGTIVGALGTRLRLNGQGTRIGQSQGKYVRVTWGSWPHLTKQSGQETRESLCKCAGTARSSKDGLTVPTR